MNPTREQPRKCEAGFSLVETMIAMGILATGLLSLAGVFVLGMGHLAASSANLTAREKAREAIESVHTARDTKTITWAQIRNVADGGVFSGVATLLLTPGPDGLVNTADDGQDTSRPYCHPNCVEEELGTGPDNILGNTDDVHMPLSGYTRLIVIREIPNTDGRLREIEVTVTYPRMQRAYKLTTYISSIS